MPATISHLQLETYFLKEISYSVKSNLDELPKKISGVKPISLDVADLTTPVENETDNLWRCELTINSSKKAEEENPFYDFKIVMVGFFRVNPGLSPEQAQTLAKSNCPAVLYSTSREIIATVTRRSPYPAVLLPLVTFVQPVSEPKKTKKPVKKKTA